MTPAVTEMPDGVKLLPLPEKSLPIVVDVAAELSENGK